MFDINKFKSLFSTAPGVKVPQKLQFQVKFQLQDRVLSESWLRFSPLVLPAQLHDLPQNYSEIIKTYNAKGDITTQQHLDRFNDFILI
jgi:hypothetical protein